VAATPLVPRIDGSELALDAVRLDPGESFTLAPRDDDTLLFVHEGDGTFVLGVEEHRLGYASAALLLAGEEATLAAGTDGLAGVRATAGPGTDRHASLGSRETVVAVEFEKSHDATGARSFQVLFGPNNGSTRSTLFVGFVPPGKAPWHYHLYDEIVWIPEGPGRLHLGNGVEELGPESSFRLRPRELHIVENASVDKTMILLGIFTPAGTPSAAYLPPEVAAEYRFTH
jgi:quercetin dioxygenase-like cupin family protein